jgi:hypothetical protein
VLTLLITLSACSTKRVDEYPEVFGIDGESSVMKELVFTDPAPVDITPKEKLYMDMVTPDTSAPYQEYKTQRVDDQIDLFKLSNPVKVP